MAKVANPADDVQFNIDWDESEKPTLDAVSDRAMGGTELMQNLHIPKILEIPQTYEQCFRARYF